MHPLALPLTLHSISPALSAIHANRVRHHPRFGGEEEEEEEKEREGPADNLTDTHCLKCGRFQLDGSADTRLVRDKPRVSAVILQKTCRSCGFIRRSPLVKEGAAAFQNRRKRNRPNPNLKPPGTQMGMKKGTQSMVQYQSPPVTQPAQAQKPTASTSMKSKNRKARSGLQEMLERKRKQDQAKSTDTSLATFLQGL